MWRRLGPLVVLGVLIGPTDGRARTWTDNRGQQTEAKFVRLFEGKVVLLRGGRTLSIPLLDLSAADQEYVRQQTAGKTGLGSLPPAVQPVTSQDGSPQQQLTEPAPLAGLRTWTDTGGRQIQAEFIEVAGGNLVLLTDGERVSLPFQNFSKLDQDYVRTVLQSQGKDHLIAGLSGPPVRMPSSGSFGPRGMPRTPGSRMHEFPQRRIPQSRQPASFPEPSQRPLPGRLPPSTGGDPVEEILRQRMPVPEQPQEDIPGINGRWEPRPGEQYGVCSNCDRRVAKRFRARGRCPYCKVVWQDEPSRGGIPPGLAVALYGVGAVMMAAIVIAVVVWIASPTKSPG